MIYTIKQAGVYQNKINSSLVSNSNSKMGYSWVLIFLNTVKPRVLKPGF